MFCERLKKGSTGIERSGTGNSVSLSDYQTLIVGGLAFTGVIATLSMNAWLARRQHDRQVQHEAQVLRTALRAELEAVADSYRDRIEMLDSPGRHTGMHVPIETMTDVYKSVIDQLGLLTLPEIRAVLRAYLLVLQLPERLSFLADPIAVRRSGFVYVSATNFPSLRALHESYVGDVAAAVSALAAHM
jgi:hypothetical protein